MFGTRANLPRPVLMIIVYGLFLVIVGVTATAQTMLVSLHFSTASLEATVGSDAATIRTFANGFLQHGYAVMRGSRERSAYISSSGTRKPVQAGAAPPL